MTEKKVIVRISKNGEIKMEAQGFTGSACLETTAKYLSGLGKVTEQKKKPEYYETVNQITAGC